MFTTDVIEAELRQFLSMAYPKLFHQYFVFTAAMAVSAVVIPVFAVKILAGFNKKHMPKAYLYKGTANLGLHYGMLFFLLAFAGRNVYQSVILSGNTLIYDRGIIWISALLMIFALFAVFFLFRFRSRGLVMAGAFVVFYAAYRQYLLFRRAGGVVSISENYNTVARYGSYCSGNFLVWESMIISISAVTILTFAAIYYYKRRFLFTPGKLGMPVCGFCGKAVSRGDVFCTNCGTQATINPIEQAIQPLDREEYCRKCGKKINEYGCDSCDTDEVLKKIADAQARKRTSIIKKAAVALIVVLGLFLPILANPVGRIEREMAKINNAFVCRWDEFYSVQEKAADPEWLAGFDSDADALYIADARWYHIKPEIVPYDKLVYYAMYAEASFRQMEKLEQMKQLVHDASSEAAADGDIASRITGLTNEFNQTVSEQSIATENYIIRRGDGLEELWIAVCNGIRYYAFRSNPMIVAVFILIMNAGMMIYLLNTVSVVTETGAERLSRFCDAKADGIIRKYEVAYHPLFSDSILHRMMTALKNCFHSFVHSICKFLVLFVRIICSIWLFLSLFRLQNIKRVLLWVMNGLTDTGTAGGKKDDYKEYNLQNRIMVAISIAIAVTVLGIPISIGLARMDRGETVVPEEQYLEKASMAVSGYSQDITVRLQKIVRTKTLTDEEREELYELFDKQMDADRKILECEMDGLESYAELHMGICGLCSDDIRVLQQIQDSINEGVVPSGELMRNYASIRGENYLWVVDELAGKFTELFTDSVFDF